MKFAIVVNEPPYTHQASDSAYHFCRAVLDAGHQIYRVFFYHDGVHNATRLATPPQDERDIVARWAELGATYGLDLVLCVAAAQRRGVIGPEQQSYGEKDTHNLADGFRIAGLGQLIDASIHADRVVAFGD